MEASEPLKTVEEQMDTIDRYSIEVELKIRKERAIRVLDKLKQEGQTKDDTVSQGIETVSDVDQMTQIEKYLITKHDCLKTLPTL